MSNHGSRSRRNRVQQRGLPPPRGPQQEVVQQQEVRPTSPLASYQSPEFTLMPPQNYPPQRMACPSVRSPPRLRFFRRYSLPSYSRLITSSTNGFDGSLMNSLQSMDQWKSFFNTPTGGTLGLLNAIQVCMLFTRVRFPASMCSCTLEEHWLSCRLPLRAVPLGRHWSPSIHLDWRRPHDCWFRPPNRMHEHQPVHWCSVSPFQEPGVTSYTYLRLIQVSFSVSV